MIRWVFQSDAECSLLQRSGILSLFKLIEKNLTCFMKGFLCASKNIFRVKNSLHIINGQVSAWQSQTLLLISGKSVQPVLARVEEPVNAVRQSSIVVVSRTMHPFPRRKVGPRESRLSQLALVLVRNPPQAKNADYNKDLCEVFRKNKVKKP